MQALFFSVFTFFSTFGGGMFAMRFKDRLHLIMGFTAGVLLGVVSFDIFPEIVSQVNTHGYGITPVMVTLVVAFLLFHIFEKVILIHHSHEGEYAEHHHPQVGILSALALAGHSFLDGVGIGLGFQVSGAVGAVVALAVIAHDFTDGMNTVTLLLSNKNSVGRTRWYLLLDAIMPMVGAASTLLFRFPPGFLVLYLGAFAGFLLYIGASDILPEAHSKHSSAGTLALTVFGALLIFVITRFV